MKGVLIKKRQLRRCFPVKFAKFLAPVLKNITNDCFSEMHVSYQTQGNKRLYAARWWSKEILKLKCCQLLTDFYDWNNYTYLSLVFRNINESAMIAAGDVTLVFTIFPSYGKYTNDTAQKMKFSDKDFWSKYLIKFTKRSPPLQNDNFSKRGTGWEFFLFRRKIMIHSQDIQVFVSNLWRHDDY